MPLAMNNGARMVINAAKPGGGGGQRDGPRSQHHSSRHGDVHCSRWRAIFLPVGAFNGRAAREKSLLQRPLVRDICMKPARSDGPPFDARARQTNGNPIRHPGHPSQQPFVHFSNKVARRHRVFIARSVGARNGRVLRHAGPPPVLRRLLEEELLEWCRALITGDARTDIDR